MTTAAQNSKQILAQKGTAATPSFSFLGGNATGMYLAGTNQLGFSTAGVNAVTIDASQNVTVTGSFITPTIAGGSTASSTLTLESTTGAGTSDSILFKTASQQTRMTIDTSGNVGIASGNLTFSATGQRITGDFSNATVANRLAFQSSTTNGQTIPIAFPNGTSVVAGFAANSSSSNPANASEMVAAVVGSSDVRFSSAIRGTGTYLPMTFYTGGSESMRIGATSGTDLGTVGIGYSTLTGVGTNGLAVLGNVGIGTSSPGYKLDVVGPSGGATQLTVSDGANQGVIRISKSTNQYGFSGGNDFGGLLFYSNNATERMRIDSSGNVGIGTNLPGYLFDTYNSSTAVDYIAGRFYSVAAATGESHTWVKVEKSSTYGGAIGGYLSQGVGSGLLFGTQNGSATPTERMRIDNAGNVGIGTTNPAGLSAKLAVVAAGDYSTAATFRSNSSTANWARTDWNNVNVAYNGIIYQDQSGLFNIRNDGANAIAFSTNGGNERMRIDSNGNVIAGASAALATTATNGFLYVPTCAGTPTGTPTTVTGMAPIVVNTTNNKLYFYSGGAWRDAGP